MEGASLVTKVASTHPQDEQPDLSPSEEVGLRDGSQHHSGVRDICRDMN